MTYSMGKVYNFTAEGTEVFTEMHNSNCIITLMLLFITNKR
jgi:hypothetical protein